MITWDSYYIFGFTTIIFMMIGAITAWYGKSNRKMALISSVMGVLVLGTFIGGLWQSLERPPLRTMGETRLWYSLFMGIAGIITYWRWGYRWILSFTSILAAVFIIINMVKPELHDKTMMPALQSAWFIPHVTVYMFSYSLLGCAFIMSVIGCFRHKDKFLDNCDQLVYVGVALLMFGMLTGSIWAKQAWGDYWSWDPKETWAAITWMGYLMYIHLRLLHRGKPALLYGILIFSFLTLQMCWYGISYLPAAKNSVHVYSQMN